MLQKESVIAKHVNIKMLFLCLLCPVFACEEDIRFFDLFPVSFTDNSGPIMMAASIPDFPAAAPMVVDTLSPLTVFDTEPMSTLPNPPTRIRTTFSVHEYNANISSSIVRLVYPQAPLISAHACGISGPCHVGNLGSKIEFTAILGGDRLSNSSVRFSFCKKELRFFPDTVGSNEERINTCDVSFRDPFKGGGTFQVDGTEIPYLPVRPSFAACLESTPIQNDSRGVDLQLLFSTAVGDLILTKTAYERYVLYAQATPFDDLPSEVIYTPSGELNSRRGSIDKLALVSPIGEDRNARGPCLELAAHRQVTTTNSFEIIDNLPCPNGDSFCQIGPAVELFDAFDVYVVTDEEPLFQSLRDELRPDLAEIDGIVGTKAMGALQVDMDYPNKRILFSCEDSNRCLVRAPIFEQDQLNEVQLCVNQTVNNCVIP